MCRLAFLLLLAATVSVWAEPALTTNGRDEVVFTSSEAAEREYPAGTKCATVSGRQMVTLQSVKLGAGVTEAKVPAASLGTENTLLTGEKASVQPGAEPVLAPLLKFLATQKDAPRATSQCVILALLHDFSFEQWLTFRRAAPMQTPDEPLLEAVDALGILRLISPEKTFRLAQDPELKLRALRHPATRGKAGQLYGLTIPGDVAPGQTPPDLGQLLHTKPGDNCPICRMRNQMQAPANSL